MDGLDGKTPPEANGGAADTAPVETTGETPQTASISQVPPAPAATGGVRKARGLGALKALPWRTRAALVIAGGLALLGAVALPLVRRASALPPARATAASLAGELSAAEAIVPDDAGSDAEADAADDAAPAQASQWRVAQLEGDPTVTVVNGALGERPLLTALAAAGLSRQQAHRVTRALAAVRDVNRFEPKDTFTIARDKATGRVVAFEIASSPTEVWQGREQDAADAGPSADQAGAATLGGRGDLVARKLDLHTEQVRVAKAVLVGSDLRASIADAGLGGPVDDVMRMLDDALDGHTELSDIRPGARLRLIATQERVDGQFVRWASLDAVEYFPAAPNAPPVRVYWFGDEHGGKHHGWYDARGRQPFHGGFRTPVPFARIASRFNPHRMHPILHVIMPHNGVDFAASTGTPVYATAAGTVSVVGPGGPCGNMVQIQHAAGITSVYCHLSRYAEGLHVGQHVEQRQLIAYVGATGRVTGPHLHFGIKRNGVFIDPMTLRLDGVRVVPRGMRDEFDRRRAQLDEELDAIALPAPPSGAAAPPPAEPGESETYNEEPP